jgi:hypothetical protein
MLLALLLAAAGPNAVITGDFDRDGRPDRIKVMKDGAKHKLVLYRSLGDSVAVETNVEVGDKFTLVKVPRDQRATACAFAAISRFNCEAGDVVRYGNGADDAMAIWNNSRFIVYRPSSSK